MANNKIDLGKKPARLEDLIEKSSSDENRTYYPDLYISDIDDPKLLDLPDEGECVIKYKIKSRTHREEKRNGEKPTRHCSITMDVLSLEPPPGKSYPKKNGNGAKDSDGGARQAFSKYFEGK